MSRIFRSERKDFLSASLENEVVRGKMKFVKGLSVRLAIFAAVLSQSLGSAITKLETELAVVKNKSLIHRGIHKRGLFYPVLLYPYNACTGILVAIAIPLNLKGRNVFLSVNIFCKINAECFSNLGTQLYSTTLKRITTCLIYHRTQSQVRSFDSLDW